MSLLARATAAGVQCNASSATANANSTGLNLLDARSNIQNFCQNFASQTIGTDQQQQQNLTTTYKPSSGNSNMQISITFTDECGSPSTTTYTIDQTICQNTFYRLLDECPKENTLKGLGHFGGTIPDGCAIYTISTSPSETIQCGSNPYTDASDIYSEAFSKAVEEYCSSPLTLTPNFVRPSGFQQSIPDGQSFANVVMEDGLVVKIVAQFNEQGSEGCVERRGFSTKGEECRRKLRGLWGACGPTGGVVVENGGRGCVVWSVWGRKI